MKRLALLFSALTFLGVPVLHAATGTIEGVVRNRSGAPVPGATVAVQGPGLTATTDAKGAYVIENVPTGSNFVVTASLAGVVAPPVTLWVVPGRNVVDFTLQPSFATDVTVGAEIPLLNASDGVSRLTLSPAQIRVLPSLGEQDIFRALQLLPGIGANETSSGLYVRGATPDQNLISYDGFTVYHVDHLFGYFSAFNMDAVEEVQLSKAASQARYGGRLSSIMEISGKAGSTEKKEFGAGVSLLSVHGLGEVPLGSKASILVAGRRSFQSPLYNKILNLVDTGGAGPVGAQGGGGPGGGPGGEGPAATFDTQPTSSFYDLNGKLLFRPGAKDQLSLSGYRGADDLDNSRDLEIPAEIRDRVKELNPGFELPDDISITDKSNWGNTGIGALWSRQWTERAQSRLSFGYSRYHSLRDQTTEAGDSQGGLAEDNSLEDLTARLDIPIRLSWNHQLELGGQVTSNDVSYTYDTSAASSGNGGGPGPGGGGAALLGILDRSETGSQYSAYIQDRATLFGKLVLTPGLRYTRYDRTGTAYVEPRVSGSLQVAQGVRVKGAWGRNHQFANRIVREDVLRGNREFWALSDGETVPVAASTHLVGGLSYEAKGFLLDVEAFRNEQTGLTQFAPRFTPSDTTEGIDFNQYFYRGEGTAKGVEVLLQRKFGKNTGWLAYTLSQTEQRFPDLEAEPFPSDYDQRHELKSVDSLRLGKWTFSGTWIFATGRPYTAPTGIEEIQLGGDGPTIARVVVGAKNGARLPAYHRLDLAVNYDFEIGPGKGTLGLTAFNVYDHQNIWYKEFTSVEGEIFENNILLMGRTFNAFLSVRF